MFVALFAAHLSACGYLAYLWGDLRDRNAFHLIVLYAFLSYYIFWAFPEKAEYVFGGVHLVFSVVFLLYSTKYVGTYLGLLFGTLVAVDVVMMVNGYSAIYPHLKGVASHLMMFAVWKGAGSERIYRPVLGDPFVSDRGRGVSGFLFAWKVRKETPKSKAG
ncbi:MAG: hypothetical protein COA96_15600 [SAR86 cluster bacterium]|uniref:Uncharacterized protein n=1 Tax=SAR86 cluster bacterium TaxID=2030880 RepID=A0A2A5AP26_9GAMM|nr:MAG: hypothetical protein COA96_15600 [SAR86 cluster bacterium]